MGHAAPCLLCFNASSSVSAAVLHSEKEFHDAAKRNDTARMEELIKRGVDIRAKNNVSLRFSHLQAAGSAEGVFENCSSETLPSSLAAQSAEALKYTSQCQIGPVATRQFHNTLKLRVLASGPDWEVASTEEG